MKKIEAKHIRKEFYVKKQPEIVLQDVSAVFDQGSTYAIQGVSGTGKSTLLHILAGLEEPTDGHVFYNHENIFQLENKTRNTILNTQVGLLFQQPYLIKELSVLENVMLPGLIAQQSLDVCKKRAEWLLNQVGLEYKKDQPPRTLSGGQQQRVALARALFNNPSFLLADEPTGNLDVETAKKMTELLLRLVGQNNMGLIVSTHDESVAEQMEKILVLRNGFLETDK